MKILRLIIPIFFILLIFSMPVSASTGQSAFFLCQKTDQNTGMPVSPDSPQYDRVDYDNPIVNLLQPFVSSLFVAIFLTGIVGGLYATVRDAFYSPSKDDDPAKFVKMRIGLLISGIGVPAVLIIGGYVAEYFTKYEVACLIPKPL